MEGRPIFDLCETDALSSRSTHNCHNSVQENLDFEIETFESDSDNETEIKQIKPKLSAKEKSFPNDKLQKAGEVIAIDKFRKKSK